jgi:hypothetical protein
VAQRFRLPLLAPVVSAAGAIRTQFLGEAPFAAIAFPHFQNSISFYFNSLRNSAPKALDSLATVSLRETIIHRPVKFLRGVPRSAG